ncbi:hypothetical protein [Pseudomonas sp.]|uniref:hypothetical protein n=1 Tax=Pseudomonas sp. TaxID=306 RepID=UPI00272A98D9|nr:hypothetical protein [Pseudomonas sp.]
MSKRTQVSSPEVAHCYAIARLAWGGSAWGRRNRAARSPHRLESASKTSIDSTFRHKVDALIRFLDAKFEQSDHEPWFSEARQLSFIPHPRPYTLGYNSNHMVADWLRSLDVDVQGNPALGRWRLEGGGVLE